VVDGGQSAAGGARVHCVQSAIFWQLRQQALVTANDGNSYSFISAGPGNVEQINLSALLI